MKCLGRNLEDHCCYLKGKPCAFLEENTEDVRWSCGLRRELGSWDAVLKDPRYKKVLGPYFKYYEKRTGVKSSCAEWPEGIGCSSCGASK